MQNTNNFFLVDDRLNPTKFNLKHNGRENVINYNPYDKFKLYDRIKVENKSTDYRNALQGSWCNCPLSKTFFSKENIELIQNILKEKVYQYSKYEIGHQNENAIKMNMQNICNYGLCPHKVLKCMRAMPGFGHGRHKQWPKPS